MTVIRNSIWQQRHQQKIFIIKNFPVSGYPKVIILNPQGRALGILGYEEGGPVNFVKKIETIMGTR